MTERTRNDTRILTYYKRITIGFKKECKVLCVIGETTVKFLSDEPFIKKTPPLPYTLTYHFFILLSLVLYRFYFVTLPLFPLFC